MKYFLYCLQHYADFNGRARRSEYWFFQLFNFLIAIGIYLIVLAIKEVIGIDLGFLRFVYPIALFIPNLAVSARRLHDTNRSGWWQLLTIITGLIMSGLVITLVYLLCLYAIWGEDMRGFSIFMEEKLLSVLLFVSIICHIAAEILLLVWYCRDSQQGVNRFGPNPKERNSANPYQQAPYNGEYTHQ